jgi:general nucleoside transport system permease protein
VSLVRENRLERNFVYQWASGAVVPILSVILAVIAGAIVVLLVGDNPWTAYSALFKGAFGSPYYFTETVIAAIPLMLSGMAVAFSFRGGLFNIGASGQLIIGAICAAFIGYKLSLPGILLVPLAILAGCLGGAVWAGLAGVLKAWRGAHEVITTMMLNYTATLILAFLVEPGPTGQSGPMESKAAYGNPLTPPMNASLPELIPQSLIQNNRIHLGLIVALAAGGIFWFLLWRTTLGYKVRAVGLNQRAAAYAGINVKWTIALTLFISGAFAGLAGMVNLFGLPPYQLGESFTANYGFNAIAVALLGRNNVVGVVLAAILFGALQQGGAIMQANTNVSIDLVNVLQGLIIFFVGADAAVRYLANRGLVSLPRWQRREEAAA